MASESKLVTRTVTRKAYLSAAGHRNLGELLGQLTWLWNIALHRRRQAWAEREESVSYYDQCKVLTKARRDPVWSRFPVMAQRSVLQRLDRAYGRFFDRVKAGGEKPGHPRFKPGDRGIRLRGRRIRVEPGRPTAVEVDGDHVGTGALEAHIDPGALDVLVPSARAG